MLSVYFVCFAIATAVAYLSSPAINLIFELPSNAALASFKSFSLLLSTVSSIAFPDASVYLIVNLYFPVSESFAEISLIDFDVPFATILPLTVNLYPSYKSCGETVFRSLFFIVISANWTSSIFLAPATPSLSILFTLNPSAEGSKFVPVESTGFAVKSTFSSPIPTSIVLEVTVPVLSLKVITNLSLALSYEAFTSATL
ncbi:Uncharacterised protein [Clostridioides difficile]|nr:Uncharacterised protein [Clostridioides difficile]